MPLDPHATATDEISGQLGNYRMGPVAGLLPANNPLCGASNGRVSHALGVNDVDNYIRPTRASPAELAGRAAPFPRLVVEVEYRHRSPRASKAHGSRLLHTAPIRAFLLFQIYPRNAAGLFAAAAVLWAKNAAGVAQLVSAISFGSAELSAATRLAFAGAIPAALMPAGVAALPAVPAAAWARAATGPATITVPATAMLNDYWDPAAAAAMPVPVPPAAGAPPDLVFDLVPLRTLGYVEVPLTHDQSAFLDVGDANRIKAEGLRLYATRKGPKACYEAKVVLPGKPYRDELLRRFLLGHEGAAKAKYISHANGDTLDLRHDNLVVSAIRPTQPVDIIKIEDVATFLEDRTNFEGRFLFSVP
eukprot:m51a1_g13112 hypothetical protein (361) ;mRNA; f:26-1847